MKIVSWNCNGKFREKFQLIEQANPDIWLIQECENPQSIPASFKGYHSYCSNYLWVGDNKSKGIAVFAKKSIKIEQQACDTEFRGRKLKWFLSCLINEQTKILCVWNHKNSCETFDYIGQFWLFMQKNRELLRGSIIAGDFNSNVIWDEWDRWWNHSDCVRELDEIGLISIYHKFYAENQGKETLPTLFLQRKFEKPYHIDYLFAPKEMSTGKLRVGKYSEWIKHSDHMPLEWEQD